MSSGGQQGARASRQVNQVDQVDQAPDLRALVDAAVAEAVAKEMGAFQKAVEAEVEGMKEAFRRLVEGAQGQRVAQPAGKVVTEGRNTVPGGVYLVDGQPTDCEGNRVKPAKGGA